MVVRMRHTRAHTKNRRSHHALEGSSFSVCSNCSAPHLRHTLCEKCGFYKKVKVVDIVKKIEKKQNKNKGKEKKDKEKAKKT